MSAITRILPKRKLSQWVGLLMYWRGPFWWARLSIGWFASYYKINLEEAEKPLSEYPSIGDFFIRKLKAGVRPVGTAWALHPADSRITQCGVVNDGTLIQAKGLTYRLRDFTQDPECENKWAGGGFITYYLCPTDYHRVHSPVDGNITETRHIPGELWPVNEWSVKNISNLFAVNERVVVEIETELGPIGVVFVGATNVGHICLSFDNSIQGNQGPQGSIRHQHYSSGIKINKGDELGMFRMGSTVVMLYPPLFWQKYSSSLHLGPQVKVNSPLT